MWEVLGGATVAAALLTLGFYWGQRTSRSTWAESQKVAEVRLKAALALEKSVRASDAQNRQAERTAETIAAIAETMRGMDQSITNFAQVLVQTGRAKELQVGEAGSEDPAVRYWREQGRHT